MSGTDKFRDGKKTNSCLDLGCEWGLTASEHERSLQRAGNILQLNCDDEWAIL